jgi:hypothetical protein
MVITTAVHARADVKKFTGEGKNERNTAEVSCGS